MRVHDEEAHLGNSSYVDRAIKAFARYGVSVESEGEPPEIDDPQHGQISWTLHYKEGSKGDLGTVDVTFEEYSLAEQDEYLQATREISRGGGLIAGINCWANIVKGEIRRYKIRMGTDKSGYVIELNPDGTVRETYQEHSENDQDPGLLNPAIQRFPPFPQLFKSFTETPVDPDIPATLLSPLGDLPNELVERLELKSGL